MPATTRSGTKQAHIDNPKETKAAVTGSKRKAPAKESKASPPKRRKADPKPELRRDKTAVKKDQDGVERGEEDAIIINRAPVLELWGGCVTSFLYPSLPWDLCLSAGSAISTICAVSKGRAIGTMEKPDPETSEKKKRERRKKAEKEQLEELEVMGFNLKLKDGTAMFGDKPKKANEVALKKKFGDEQYERAKAAFQDALSGWKDQEEELDSRAFHMYEDFRPNVATGQKGWGRKGQLSLETVKSTVSPG